MLVPMASLWEETHYYQNLGKFRATKEHILIDNNNLLNFNSFGFMMGNKTHHWAQVR